MKSELSAKFALSAPARVRNGAIATAIILLLIFAGFVHAAGDSEWNAGVNQINDALSQLHQQARGVPGAMQYVNQAENLWKQTQALWAMQQGYQQQNTANRMRTQLLTQQQNLMNQLNKQQQFLQQQLDSLKSPELKTIDPFGDYLFYGVSLHPKDGQLHGQGTIADTPEGSGMEAWEEAMRQLDSISSASSALPTPPATASKKIMDKGSWDNPLADDAVSNPYANDPNVVDLRDAKSLTPKLLREDDSKQSNYSSASDITLDESNFKLEEGDFWTTPEMKKLGTDATKFLVGFAGGPAGYAAVAGVSVFSGVINGDSNQKILSDTTIDVATKGVEDYVGILVGQGKLGIGNLKAITSGQSSVKEAKDTYEIFLQSGHTPISIWDMYSDGKENKK